VFNVLMHGWHAGLPMWPVSSPGRTRRPWWPASFKALGLSFRRVVAALSLPSRMNARAARRGGRRGQPMPGGHVISVRAEFVLTAVYFPFVPQKGSRQVPLEALGGAAQFPRPVLRACRGRPSLPREIVPGCWRGELRLRALAVVGGTVGVICFPDLLSPVPSWDCRATGGANQIGAAQFAASSPRTHTREISPLAPRSGAVARPSCCGFTAQPR